MLDWSVTDYRKPIRIHKPPTGWFVVGDPQQPMNLNFEEHLNIPAG